MKQPQPCKASSFVLSFRVRHRLQDFWPLAPFGEPREPGPGKGGGNNSLLKVRGNGKPIGVSTPLVVVWRIFCGEIVGKGDQNSKHIFSCRILCEFDQNLMMPTSTISAFICVFAQFVFVCFKDDVVLLCGGTCECNGGEVWRN